MLIRNKKLVEIFLICKLIHSKCVSVIKCLYKATQIIVKN